MTFNVRYDGTCATCQGKINKGDPVKWNRLQRGVIYHATCEMAKTTEKQPLPVGDSNEAINALASALKPLISGTIDRDEVAEIVKAEVSKAALPIIIEVKRPEGHAKIEGAHKQLETLIKALSALPGERRNAYIYGLPGSGKTTAAKMLCKAFGHDPDYKFGTISLNPQTSDTRILGFKDAVGNYQPSLFRRIYEHGGVFNVDELDNAAANLLTTINSGVENGVMAFPDGLVKRHEDFILIASGNTNGRGGNSLFPERRKFDGAFHDRFLVLEWEYDENLETQIGLSIYDKAERWVHFVQMAREYCHKNQPQLLVTPRATIAGSYLLKQGFKSEDVAEMVVFRGIDKGTKETVLKNVQLPNYN